MNVKLDYITIDHQQDDVLPVLKTLLVDEFMLYVSMISVNFYPLPDTLADHINELDDLIDKASGYIQQYGTKAARAADDFVQDMHIRKAPGRYPSTRAQIINLVSDHNAIIRILRENINRIDEESKDVDAVDLMINLLQRHQKMMRSLRVYLEG